MGEILIGMACSARLVRMSSRRSTDNELMAGVEPLERASVHMSEKGLRQYQRSAGRGAVASCSRLLGGPRGCRAADGG